MESASSSTWKRIERVAVEFHDDLRPGVLMRLREVLERNHFEISLDTDPPFSLRAGILKATRTR
jgi:hypothetical protein